MRIMVWVDGKTPSNVIYANSRTGTVKYIENGAVKIERGIVDIALDNPESITLDGVQVTEVVEEPKSVHQQQAEQALSS